MKVLKILFLILLLLRNLKCDEESDLNELFEDIVRRVMAFRLTLDEGEEIIHKLHKKFDDKTSTLESESKEEVEVVKIKSDSKKEEVQDNSKDEIDEVNSKEVIDEAKIKSEKKDTISDNSNEENESEKKTITVEEKKKMLKAKIFDDLRFKYIRPICYQEKNSENHFIMERCVLRLLSVTYAWEFKLKHSMAPHTNDAIYLSVEKGVIVKKQKNSNSGEQSESKKSKPGSKQSKSRSEEEMIQNKLLREKFILKPEEFLKFDKNNTLAYEQSYVLKNLWHIIRIIMPELHILDVTKARDNHIMIEIDKNIDLDEKDNKMMDIDYLDYSYRVFTRNYQNGKQDLCVAITHDESNFNSLDNAVKKDIALGLIDASSSEEIQKQEKKKALILLLMKEREIIIKKRKKGKKKKKKREIMIKIRKKRKKRKKGKKKRK